MAYFSHKFANCSRIAVAVATMCIAFGAVASETYTFNSGPLDSTSFTIAFTVDNPLADGIYNWTSNDPGIPSINLPSNFIYAATDGFTTDTDDSDMSPGFNFTVSAGKVTTYAVYDEDSHSPVDPFYGETYFYGAAIDEGNGQIVRDEQLQDVNDPGIVGLDYDGHHIPVVSGSGGYWTYSTSAVPEPASEALLGLGLAGMCAAFSLKRRKSVTR